MEKANENEIVRVLPPKKSDILVIRSLIMLAAISLGCFMWWFINEEHIGHGLLFAILTFALFFKIIKMVHEWYHYWAPSVPAAPKVTRQYAVDVLTTACPGEPKEMIIRTLRAMVAMKYPHTNYLCDEGDDPELKRVCEELGIVHVTRKVKVNAKAGNINNALRQATGEISIVLDPDHEPVPEFIDRVLPYFEDEKIGFVQSVQGYYNQDESFIARGAAEQTYHFYGPMMMCMNTYGTAQAIGANCAFRRKALDSIGGHAAGLSEDMHTAMQLHAKGWKSVYIPEILTRGLVPATLSAYYKQQLKWSRGTFELLFRTYPQLYRNFTWRQKIHYFTIPLYFLFGLINLIDIAVPLLALSLADVPWQVDLAGFAAMFLPLCVLSLMIRIFAQRWLLEKHERGLHLTGGIVRTATWWIFLIGFIYSIFKVKVPYIPTPKEDEHQNYIRLSIPNVLIILVSGLLVAYGLNLDWTPYSIAMAGYSALTAAMLGVTIVMSQQKFLLQAKTRLGKVPVLAGCAQLAGKITNRSGEIVYQLLRNGPIMLLMALSLVFASYSGFEPAEGKTPGANKELGGFYLGHMAGSGLPFAQSSLPEPNFNVISFNRMMGANADPLPAYVLSDLGAGGSIPFISWQVPQEDSAQAFCRAITEGNLDGILETYANSFRRYGAPVFVTFRAPSSSCSAKDFTEAWQHLYTFFNNLGISNLTWVWCPESPGLEAWYPGEKFVDWLGVTALNPAHSPSEAGWYSFAQIYGPYRKAYGKFLKPVFITSLGSAAGPSQESWFREAFSSITAEFEEVKGANLFYGVANAGNASAEVSYRLSFGAGQWADLSADLEIRKFHLAGLRHQTYTSPFVKGPPGSYTLVSRSLPFYIRGVAYNTGHDWRDGNMPLTRKQLEKDFADIRAMGANTIRRYGTSVYDRNVVKIAGEYGLKLMYGFWFDPAVDYFSDEEKVQEYLDEVEEMVLRYRDEPSVLAWSIGNESWGLLKHRYAKPYLVNVRRAYVQMIERMARRIHQLDPTRPVFTCMEHEEYQLAGELVAFRDGAPSVDAIGINSYYREQISNLNHVAWQFDSLRPYLVSEFGPSGYWDPKYNKTSNGSLTEQTDAEKAAWYQEQWKSYVKAYAGYNVGGFAYCWHDRMEGSSTWFGLTDYRGRLKPSYYALKDIWTGTSTAEPEFTILAPSQVSAGGTYTITAAGGSLLREPRKMEWKLLRDEFLGEAGDLEPLDDYRAVQVTMPREPSKYRLYLYAYDDRGHVSTASVPLPVTVTSRQ